MFKKSISVLNVKKIVMYSGVMVASCILPEIVLANNVDTSVITGGVDSLMKMLVKLAKDYSMMCVALAGIVSAVLGGGDLRQRSIAAGTGTLFAFIVVTILLSMAGAGPGTAASTTK